MKEKTLIRKSNHQRQLAALLFTDIVGYTQIMEKDEQVALAYLKRKRQIIYPLVEEHGGRVLKEIGDAMLIKFGSAIQAVRCAIGIQKAFREIKDFSLRIGAHIGDVVMEQEDVFGSGVNIASRLQSLAMPGGILVSGDVWRQIRNQTDFSAISLGTKKLKGIEEPIEVFQLIFETQEEKASLLKKLYERRFFHIVGLYLIVGVLILAIIGAIIDYFVLSPHLLTLCILLSLFLLPSVLYWGYYHGRREPPWGQWERMGLGFNLVLAILLVGFLFHDKNLGMAITSFSLKDEKGQTLEVTVPYPEFRKSVVLFFLDNTTKDPGLDWLSSGIPDLVEYRLLSNLFVNPWLSYDIVRSLKGTAFATGTGLMIPLKEKLAKEIKADYFTAGHISKEGDQFFLRVSLYKTESGQKISTRDYHGVDIFQLVDQIVFYLARDLGVPRGYLSIIEPYRPLSQSFTNSFSVYRLYSLGKAGIRLEKNSGSSLQFLEQALKEDPSLIPAQYELARGYLLAGQTQKSLQALEMAFPWVEKLPLRLQLALKGDYYFARNEAEKAMALAKVRDALQFQDSLNWGIFFNPQTVGGPMEELEKSWALEQGVPNRLSGSKIDKTIAHYQRSLELDPTQYDLLYRIGFLYEQKGEYDKALEYYRRFSDRSPGEFIDLTLGRLYKGLGEYSQALQQYEKALAFLPKERSLILEAADLERRMGDPNRAVDRYLEALAVSSPGKEKVQIYKALQALYEEKGQLKSAAEYRRLKFSEGEKFLLPADLLFYRVEDLICENCYIKKEDAQGDFRILVDQALPPSNELLPLVYLAFYIQQGDLQNAEKAWEQVKGLSQKNSLEKFRPLILEAQGRLQEKKGAFSSAIEIYQEKERLNPLDIGSSISIARCYRKLKELNRAENHLKAVLKKRPYTPEAQYELALVYAERGDESKALEHLKVALKYWKDADAEYLLATKAREKLNILESAIAVGGR